MSFINRSSMVISGFQLDKDVPFEVKLWVRYDCLWLGSFNLRKVHVAERKKSRISPNCFLEWPTWKRFKVSSDSMGATNGSNAQIDFIFFGSSWYLSNKSFSTLWQSIAWNYTFYWRKISDADKKPSRGRKNINLSCKCWSIIFDEVP